MQAVGELPDLVADGVAVSHYFLEIAAGTEKTPRRPQHHDLDTRVVIAEPRRLIEFAAELCVEAVGIVGAVQRNPRNRALALE